MENRDTDVEVIATQVEQLAADMRAGKFVALFIDTVPIEPEDRLCIRAGYDREATRCLTQRIAVGLVDSLFDYLEPQNMLVEEINQEQKSN